jgi:hypothetical protein
MIVILALAAIAVIGLATRQPRSTALAPTYTIGPRQAPGPIYGGPIGGLPPVPCSVGRTMTIYDDDASPPTDTGPAFSCGPELDFGCIRGPAGTTCGTIVG